MDTETPQNIILTGFSFTGKSAVGREVACYLGWDFADSDDEIVKLAGKDIAAIFAEDGEVRFRELERQVLAHLCEGESQVIATGGGAVVDARNRELFAQCGVVVCLEAGPETIHQRLQAAQEAYHMVRPLLAIDNPLEHIRGLKASRQQFYDTADWKVSTDLLSVDQVADEVVTAFRQVAARRKDPSYYDGASFVVTTPSETYPVFVGWGLLREMGKLMGQTRLGRSTKVISDGNVLPHYGGIVTAAMERAGLAVECLAVPAGETSKCIESASKLYDWLVDTRVERDDSIIALGGGMVGDLAGFVAATFLRGLPLVQAPTSLVAMADSSIGGKVAVNHPRAKNLIGSFYQPHLVVMDVTALSTLPRRELTSGWAEVIKHAMVLAPDFLRFLELHVDRLRDLEAEATTEAVRRSASIKGRVVSEDEREHGKRTVLNYGHTIAHGLEAAAGYERFLHGEAVAIGMMGAALLSQRLGLISEDIVLRQQRLLESFGLPTSCSDVDPPSVVGAMELDKKVREKSVRWVLLGGIGTTVIRDDVPPQEVASVLRELMTEH